jgi:hypothetical protein
MGVFEQASRNRMGNRSIHDESVMAQGESISHATCFPKEIVGLKAHGLVPLETLVYF